VIAAVGHEPDVTIADFAADLRASTPSNGAERAVPDQGELRDVLAHWEARLQRAMDRTLQKGRDRLERAKASPFLQSPLRTIQEKRMLLDYQQQRLVHGMERNLQTGREQTARLAASLEALSPFRVLSRGYSIAQKEDGTVLSSIQQVSVGEALSLRLADGQVTCTATGKDMARLEEIVAQLEAGDHPLAESLSLYEEGAKLMKQCVTMLDKAEQKVMKLRLDETGELKEVPFVPEES